MEQDVSCNQQPLIRTATLSLGGCGWGGGAGHRESRQQGCIHNLTLPHTAQSHVVLIGSVSAKQTRLASNQIMRKKSTCFVCRKLLKKLSLSSNLHRYLHSMLCNGSLWNTYRWSTGLLLVYLLTQVATYHLCSALLVSYRLLSLHSMHCVTYRLKVHPQAVS